MTVKEIMNLFFFQRTESSLGEAKCKITRIFRLSKTQKIVLQKFSTVYFMSKNIFCINTWENDARITSREMTSKVYI